MNEEERRKLMESLIEEIQIYEERQPNGQWLKSITFRLPIIEKDMKISVEDGLDSEQHIETVCLLTRLSEAKTNHVSVQD
jgi:site-specific DNA recombinase